MDVGKNLEQGNLCQALEEIVAALKAQAGTLWFYHRFHDGLIRPLAVSGGSGLEHIYLLPGEGVAGQVIDRGEPIMIADCQNDPRWSRKVDAETGFVTRSTLCVPLKTGDLVFGSIQLVNKTDGTGYGSEDLACLTRMGEALARTMEHQPCLREYRASEVSLEKENDIQRSMIKRLSAYIDPAVIHEILRGDGTHKKSIETKPVTVLFADVRGSVSLSQKLSAPQLISALSDFMSLTSRCVHRFGGIIDKFMGDCIMAYWKDADTPNARALACRCALEIQTQIREASSHLQRQTGQGLSVGIGIHSGPALLCHVGDEEYMAYTVLGSTVNSACRMEEFAPSGSVYISQEVADGLPGGQWRPVEEPITWRGKDESLVILELESIE